MPRIRTLKPEILEDTETAGLTDAAFRLFVALIVLADDHGNTRGDDRWLRGQIWWAHREPPRISEILRELSGSGLVVVYTVRGQVYASVTGWTKHQRIDNASKPRVPIPNDPESLPFEFDEPVDCRDSRNSAEDFGEIPLDPDHRPPTTDQDPDGEPAAKRVVKTKRSRRSPLPADWKPDETAFVKARELGVDANLEADSFRDHHAAKGSTFIDWQAAFRTWLGNAKRFARGGGSYAPRNNPTETALAGLREAQERERKATADLFGDAPHAAEAS